MSLNANYTFEDLGDLKCSIIEKNCSQERVDFLKSLLEFNGFEVKVVKSPPPKGTKAAPAENTEEGAPTDIAIVHETFTVGVTDLTFNPVNGVYNRQLKTENGKFVTPFYWNQIDKESQDEVWYWKKRSKS
ncbi:MAG: hypothetical protein NTU43_09870 [Bacteroidetes bacterium]|nr:hypothetical protein [Bacteroidota bacterium]